MPLEFGKSYNFTQLVKQFKSKLVDQGICYKLYRWCIQNIIGAYTIIVLEKFTKAKVKNDF